jgi:hypothetical protein
MTVKGKIYILVAVLAIGLFGMYLQPRSGKLPASPEPAGPAVSVPYPINQDREQHQPQGIVDTRDEPQDGTAYHSSTPSKPVIATKPPIKPLIVAAQTPVKQVAYFNNDHTFVTIDNTKYPNRQYNALMTPDDPLASQWWTTDSKLDQAWDIAAGSNDTLLAVVDSGIAMNHEEYADRIYSNPGEQGETVTEAPSRLNCTDRSLAIDASCNLVDDDGDGIVDNESGAVSRENPSRRNCTDQGIPLDKACNLIDDDNNGYVDDVHGWDFADYDNSPQAGELDPAGSGTTHGTRVLGIAAAAGNNSKGIAGADWHTKILPIQALDDEGAGNTFDVGRSILYAVAMGAKVINISLGSDQTDDYVRQAVKTATKAGVIVVAAAGNSGTSTCGCMVYPAANPESLAVGALDSTNNLASFSSYGPNLDILAPGANMTSTNWTAANPTNSYASGINGTSYAAPLVSGLLTRLLSQQPNATPLQLIALLTENTNRLTLPATSNRSDKFGYGKVDAFKATSRNITPLSTPIAYVAKAVSIGAYLSPTQPSDQAGSIHVMYCNNTPGTTPIYAVANATNHFYSISPEEVWAAEQVGYTSSIFQYACLSQPTDILDSIRLLDIDKEFRNLFNSHSP